MLAMCLSITACGSDQPSHQYFPLQQGLNWHYETIITTPSRQERSELSITHIGTQIIDEEIYHVRKTTTGNFYYLQQRGEDIVRLARRNLSQRHPQFDETPRFVIKSPLQTGTNWRQMMKPYLLYRPHQSDSELLRRIVDYEMTWEIIATDDTVEVAAGRFEHCLHIRGTGTVSIQRPLSIARDDVIFTTSEWYAPQVGLVRLEHHEDLDSNQTTGGTITLSLVAFNT